MIDGEYGDQITPTRVPGVAGLNVVRLRSFNLASADRKILLLTEQTVEVQIWSHSTEFRLSIN
jgi:hypothetical protein